MFLTFPAFVATELDAGGGVKTRPRLKYDRPVDVDDELVTGTEWIPVINLQRAHRHLESVVLRQRRERLLER